MRGNFMTSRAFILVLAVLLWLIIATVIAAAPLLTKSSEQPSRPRAPTATPASSEDPIPRVHPRLALNARAAAYAPGALRFRISTSGTFRPTSETPAQLRVVLTATEAPRTTPFNRVIRRVALTDAALSAVFRHLQPGTWRWEVDAASSWTLAFVHRDSGRVAVTAHSPPPEPPPAPEPTEENPVGAGAEAQAPSEPAYESEPATTSTQPGVPAAKSPKPAPTQGDGGGQSHPPAAPFGGGGAPTPEGPHAP
jgi:hypothetical protein